IGTEVATTAPSGDPAFREVVDEGIARPLRRHITKPLRGWKGWVELTQAADDEDRHLLPRHRSVGTVVASTTARGDAERRELADLLVERMAQRHVIELRRLPHGEV